MGISHSIHGNLIMYYIYLFHYIAIPFPPGHGWDSKGEGGSHLGAMAAKMAAKRWWNNSEHGGNMVVLSKENGGLTCLKQRTWELKYQNMGKLSVLQQPWLGLMLCFFSYCWLMNARVIDNQRANDDNAIPKWGDGSIYSTTIIFPRKSYLIIVCNTFFCLTINWKICVENSMFQIGDGPTSSLLRRLQVQKIQHILVLSWVGVLGVRQWPEIRVLDI